MKKALDLLKLGWSYLIQTGTVRRLLVFAVSTACALLAKKLGIEVSESVQLRLVELAMIYLVGSNVKDAVVARLNMAQAKAIIEKGPQP